MSASIPAHIAQTLLDLRARRDFLSTAIDVLSQIWEGGSDVEVVVALPAAAPAASRVPPKPERRAAPRQREDDALTADAEAVLKVLRHAKQPMKPGEVFAAARIAPEQCAKVKYALRARHLLTIIGAGHASRWSLAPAGAPAPKEGL